MAPGSRKESPIAGSGALADGPWAAAKEAVIDQVGAGKFGESGEDAGLATRNRLAELEKDGILKIELDKSTSALTLSGPFSRWANPANGGPFRRWANPANGGPFRRWANLANGGPFRRWANLANGGPFRRWANPANGGPFSRWANPANGGPFRRWANPANGGPFRRWANPANGGLASPPSGLAHDCRP